MKIDKVIDDGMTNTVTVLFSNLGIEFGSSVERGSISCKIVAVRRANEKEARMVPVRDFFNSAEATALEGKLRTHLTRNNYFDLPLGVRRSDDEMMETRHKAEDDFDRCVNRATELRDALRAVLDTRDILRAHPENDTTKVLDEKLMNVEHAEVAARKLLQIVDGE